MKVAVFVISFVIFVASIYLFSFAFQLSDDSMKLLAFFGAIIGVSISFAIPVHLLKRTAP